MDTWMFTPIVVVTLLLLAGPGALGEQERGPPSALEDLSVIRQSSASMIINLKAPKQEEQVLEYFISYSSLECCSSTINRWACSRPGVANCALTSFLSWRFVNESSLPVILIDLCAGRSYHVFIRAINNKGQAGPHSHMVISANGSRSDDGTSSSPSSTSSPTETSSSPSSTSSPTETSSSPSSPSNTTENSSSASNTTEKPRIIIDPPSQLEVINSVRLSSALAAINVKAPKQEEGVVEIYVQYTSVECRGNKRWNCSRHRVSSCALQGYFFWQYVNESSSLPVILSRLCPGDAYDVYTCPVKEQLNTGPWTWFYVHGNVDGIWPRPSSPSNTADTSSRPSSPSNIAETSSSPPSPSNPTENPLTIQVLLAGNQTTETPDKLTAGFTTTQLALGGIALFSMFLMIVLVLRIRSLVTAKRRRESLKNQKLSTKSRDFDCVLVLSPNGVDSSCNDETKMAVMNRKEEEVEDVLSSGGGLKGSLSSQANSQVHVCVFDPEETCRKDQLQCAQSVGDDDKSTCTSLESEYVCETL
ncbi:uncharacterized protein LOC135826063 isoform X1 [Sycon ciliatum]|uniref:uncharacterized protein LOC135826063 isoform X1 n=2 Tax=Sycon ciliatum TaxID=27933 RepID=UPI0031F71A5A